MKNLPRLILLRLHILAIVTTALLIILGFFSFLFNIADSVGHFRWHLSLLLLFLTLPGIFIYKRYITFAMLSLLAISYLSTTAILWPVEDVPSYNSHEKIRLMQFNLSFRNQKLDNVVELIMQKRPDVVTLQEVTRRTGTIISKLAAEFPHYIRCPFSTVGGVAVLSRYPIESGTSHGCVKNEGLAWLRVLVHGRPLSIASLHLHWPYPYGQHGQITRLERHFRNIPQPVLMVGDFNAAPWSNAIARVSSATSTRVEDKLLFSFSYPLGGDLPAVELPIDHILLPQRYKITHIELGPDTGSDHYPLFAEISVY